MPYIAQTRRDELKRLPVPKTAGELNYLITLELLKVYEDGGKYIAMPTVFKFEVTEIIESYLEQAKPSYQTINDVLGALSGAALEFDRRYGENKNLLYHYPRLGNTVYADILKEIRTAFYYNIAVPYENKKIAENGDVYPTE